MGEEIGKVERGGVCWGRWDLINSKVLVARRVILVVPFAFCLIILGRSREGTYEWYFVTIRMQVDENACKIDSLEFFFASLIVTNSTHCHNIFVIYFMMLLKEFSILFPSNQSFPFFCCPVLNEWNEWMGATKVSSLCPQTSHPHTHSKAQVTITIASKLSPQKAGVPICLPPPPPSRLNTVYSNSPQIY